MTLQLVSQLRDDAAVLFCEGDLVGGDETRKLREAITNLLRKRDQVILDLSGVVYMNSAGLSTLVGLYSTARTSGGSIRYVNLQVATDFRRPKSSTIAA